MQLYNVHIELVEMVLAESPEEAKRIAIDRNVFEDAARSLSEVDLGANEASYMPGGYESDSFVFHEQGGDITVDQAIEMTGNKLREKEAAFRKLAEGRQ